MSVAKEIGLRMSENVVSKSAKENVTAMARAEQGDTQFSHLVITVHGIRTFGQWQERLEALIRAVEPNVTVYNYRYGYFSVIAFMIPVLRWLVTRRFRRELLQVARLNRWDRIDIVAHSFGTHLVGWGLYGLDPVCRPAIHTIVLAGSVLKAGFPWRELLHTCVRRLVNECGIQDRILVLNQVFVLFSGVAGRLGFNGMTGSQFRNRYFRFGHSGYFTCEGRPADDFMKERWVPLLTRDELSLPIDERGRQSAIQGLLTFALNNAEPLKLTAYATPLIIGIVTVYGLYVEADLQRRIAVERLARSYWDSSRTERNNNNILRSLHLAEEAAITSPDGLLSRAIVLDTSTNLPVARLTSLVSHAGAVLGAVLDEDERRLLTWSRDNTARVWDAVSGDASSKPLRHDKAVLGAAFGTLCDCVLTWSADHTLRLWDATTGTAIASPLRHSGAVLGAVFSKDGTRILSWSADGSARQWTLAGEMIGSPMKHSDWVWGATYDPDGRTILTWSFDGTARLWDTAAGGSIGRPLRHLGIVGALFNNAGTRVLTYGLDNALQQWDTATGKRFGTALVHPNATRWGGGTVWKAGDEESRIFSYIADKATVLWPAQGGFPIGAAYSQDDSRILTWGADSTARQWNAASCRESSPPIKHGDWVWGAQYTAKESRVLTWSKDGTAQISDAATSAQIAAILRNGESARGAQFNSDESQILTWGDRSVRLWDLNAGTQVGPELVHAGVVSGAKYSQSGARVVTWGVDGTTRLWRVMVATSRPLAFPHGGSIRGARFNKAETEILSYGSDGMARLWNAADGTPIGNAMRHEGPIVGAVFDEQETRVLAWSADGTARVWSNVRHTPNAISVRHKDIVRGASFANGERQVLTWSNDGDARLWNTADGSPAGLVFRHGDTVSGAHLFHGDSRLLTWSFDGAARVWDVLTGAEIQPRMVHQAESSKFEAKGFWIGDYEFKGPFPESYRWVTGAAVDEREERILTWGMNGALRLWAIEGHSAIGPVLQHDGAVGGARFNKAGTKILSWANDKTARLWNTQNGEQIGRTLAHEGDVVGAAFDRDETIALTWSADGTAKFWDVETGEPIGRTLTHEGFVRGAAFSTDEALVLTFSDDHTVRLWEVASGKLLGPVMRHSDWVFGAAFNRDETLVLTWTNDGTVGLWEIPGDLDFPQAALKLQLSAITGTEFDSVTGEIRIIEASRWRMLDKAYRDLARAHYESCKYRRQNVYHRFAEN